MRDLYALPAPRRLLPALRERGLLFAALGMTSVRDIDWDKASRQRAGVLTQSSDLFSC
jgi:hypothetical protein